MVGPLAAAAVVAGTTASNGEDFITPGGAAYCRMEFSQRSFEAVRCIRPSTGFWVRLEGVMGDSVRVRTGRSHRFRTLRHPGARHLGYGAVFYSSDAALVTCRVGRAGITCKHAEGLSFFLGRTHGYRVYYDAPGSPPLVRPLFRTASAWCGIDLETQEPSIPTLVCWRPADGLELTMDPIRVPGQSRVEKAIGFRPREFRKLAPGSTFTWRCKHLEGSAAWPCSTGPGHAVFTCSNTGGRVTCRNRKQRGFWVDAAAFELL